MDSIRQNLARCTLQSVGVPDALTAVELGRGDEGMVFAGRWAEALPEEDEHKRKISTGTNVTAVEWGSRSTTQVLQGVSTTRR